MASFSVTDAAFAGFRVVRQRPASFAAWVLLNFIVSLGALAVAIPWVGPALAQLQNTAPASPDPRRGLALLQQLAPFYLVAIVFALAAYCVGVAAINRVVLRPDERRFAYLRLGGDELRQFGLVLLCVLVGLGAEIAAAIVMVVGALILSAALKGMPAAGAVVGFVAMLALMGAAIFVGVRLSLAPSVTFATGRVNLFGSWAITRRHFWALLGAYLIVLLLVIIVWLLGMALIAAIALAAGGFKALGPVFHPELRSLAVYLSPVQTALLALSSVLTTLIWLLQRAPQAAIYQSLTRPAAAGLEPI